MNRIALACCVIFGHCFSWAHGETDAKHSPDTQKMFESHQHTSSDGQALNYRLMRPQQVEGNQKYPLVIFLHGAGERGDDNQAQLKHGMPELCKAERRAAWPCYVLAPQCPRNQKWADVNFLQGDVKLPERISRSLELTLEVVDKLLREAAIDADRIYITGLSMGGFGTWDALVRRPNFFAAAMPICGGGDPATAAAIQHIPVACFHGADDRIVTPEKSQRIIEALRKLGAQPTYVEYPGVAHNSWEQAYSNDDNWKWLFSQRRPRGVPASN
ncbi:MAG: prolyl oligopeptidase family serine peptidase [Pirellulaceae bacterium]|nr:prolyl oligopeptidase family serine peptidase [Pirellulaceae bacterium]